MDFLSDIFGGPLGTNLFGKGTLFDDMAVPGMPTTVPGGGVNMPLLKAGDNDMKPPGLLSPPGAGLQRAGQEPGFFHIPSTNADIPAAGAQPVGLKIDAPANPASAANARSDGPPLATPQQAAAGRTTPGTPAAVAPPLAPTAPSTPSDPALRAPYATPGSPVPASPTGAPAAGGGPSVVPAPSTTPAATPATSGTTFDKQKMIDFLSKLPSGGGAGPQVQGHAPGAIGQPHIPQGGAQLFQSILEAHAKALPQIKKPEMPASLLQRFRV